MNASDHEAHALGSDAARSLRRSCYALFIVLAAGAAAGRILNAELVLEPSIHRPADRPDLPGRAWPATPPRAMPTFSSNDRARWATVRALVDDGTFVVGRRIEIPANDNANELKLTVLLAARMLGHGNSVLSAAGPVAVAAPLPMYADRGIIFEDGWGTVDRVLHPDKKEYHSSKPPFLSTLVAGEYWALQKLTGWTLKDNPFPVVRVILFTVNWLPMVLALLCLAALVERFGRSDWAKLVVMAAACFATFLDTFIITLNNHTLAAQCVLFSLVPFVAICCDGKNEAWRYALAGFFAAFTACCELPAAAFGGLLFLILAWHDWRRTLLFFVPAALVPLAVFVGTNYLAIGEVMPAYDKFGSIWYNYPGSYWSRRRGIDAGRDSLEVYAFHMLLGHHGLFSLSPIFLLSLLGMAGAFFRSRNLTPQPPSLRGKGGQDLTPQPPSLRGKGEQDLTPQPPSLRGKGEQDLTPQPPSLRGKGEQESLPSPRWGEGSRVRGPAGLRTLILLGGVLLVVVAIFYIVYVFHAHDTRNYGGWTSGPRWTFWLVPFLLLALLPPLEWLAGSRFGRAIVYVLLAFSALSANYPAWNPWRHPWLHNLLESYGVIRY